MEWMEWLSWVFPKGTGTNILLFAYHACMRLVLASSDVEVREGVSWSGNREKG